MLFEQTSVDDKTLIEGHNKLARHSIQYIL